MRLCDIQCRNESRLWRITGSYKTEGFSSKRQMKFSIYKCELMHKGKSEQRERSLSQHEDR